MPNLNAETYDGQACSCCAMAIANGEDCDCEPGTHDGYDDSITYWAIATTEDDCEPWFSWSPCDVCGSRLGGDRMHVTGWMRATDE